MQDSDKLALRIRRLGIDTYQEPVVFIREDSAMFSRLIKDLNIKVD